MRLMIILIAFWIVKKSLQRVQFHEENTVSVNRVFCVNLALETFLNDDWNVQIFSRNMNIPVKNLTKIPHFLITDWDLLREPFFDETAALIIFLEGNVEDDFNGLERLRGTVMVQPVLIVCIADVVCGSEKYMQKIIEVFTGEKFQYVAVDGRGRIYIHEYTETAAGSCGTAQLIRRGLCSDKSTVKKVFQMAMNIQKCPLRVVVCPSPALSVLCNPDGRSNPLCGIEAKVVQVLADKINATSVLQLVPSPDVVRRLVASGEADLGIGGLDAQPFEGISYSKPYMFVQATVVAPHSTWSLGRFLLNIFQPFEYQVWVGISVAMVSIFILRLLIPYFRRIFPHQLFGIFFGFPVPRPPRALSSTRIYFISWVLFGYFCSQSYLTNLTKMLSTPRQNIIRSLRDLEKSKLRVFGVVASREKFKNDYPRIYRDFVVENHTDYYANLLQVLWGRSSSVYYVEDVDSNIATWRTVEGLRDRINWYPVVLAAQNTSAVLQIANELLPRIWESGMLKAHNTFSSIDDYRSPEILNHTSSRQSGTLQFEDLESVFILLICGLSLSLFVFLIEIITTVIKKRLKLKERLEIQTELPRQERPHGIIIPKETIRARVFRFARYIIMNVCFRPNEH